MRLENEQVHYRAQFVIWPYDCHDSPMPHIVDMLQHWVSRKEFRRRKAGEVSRVGKVLSETTSDLQRRIPEALAKPCSVSGAFWDGFKSRDGYDGSASSATTTKLCSERFKGYGTDSLPQYWAFEYDEPEPCLRHWHTSVGITRTSFDGDRQLDPDAPCIVNIRVTHYMRPDFIGKPPEAPLANTPSFVPWLLDLPGFMTCVGDTEVRDEATYLDAATFERDFKVNLIDPQRGLPLILTTTDRYGGASIPDVDEFAKTLRGTANVYVVDFRDQDLKARMYDLFRRNEPSWRYNCGAGITRIYQPGIDISDSRAAARHRFFLPDEVEKYGDSFADVIAKSLIASRRRDATTVIDTSDVKAMASQERGRELRRRLDEQIKLTEQTREQEGNLSDGAVTKEAYEDVVRDRDVYLGLAQDYADQLSLVEGGRPEDREYISTLESELDRASKTEVDLTQKIESLRYGLSAKEDARSNREHQGTDARPLDCTKERPRSLDEMLTLFEHSYPDRLVVLPEAHESAVDYATTDADDDWSLLWSLPNQLWSIIFGAEPFAGDLTERYHELSGHEYAPTEKKLTKANAAMMAERQKQYRGDTVSCIAHVKGSGRNMTRIYFYLDHDRQLIVIGHCGSHLTTAGTAKM